MTSNLELEENNILNKDVVLDTVELGDYPPGEMASSNEEPRATAIEEKKSPERQRVVEEGREKPEEKGERVSRHNESASASRPANTYHHPCSCCNDSERAILNSYVALMRQCIELAEKVVDAKA